MIKNSIIIILILLLLITLYSYYCLSSKMLQYEKDRLETIINKENYVKLQESKIEEITNCNLKLSQFNEAFIQINKIMGVKFS